MSADNDVRTVLSEARAEIEWWEREHGCCAGKSDDVLTRIDAFLTRADLTAGSPLGRDADWVLAIAHALGTESGYRVPIVPDPAEFRRLFAAIRRTPAEPVGYMPIVTRRADRTFTVSKDRTAVYFRPVYDGPAPSDERAAEKGGGGQRDDAFERAMRALCDDWNNVLGGAQAEEFMIRARRELAPLLAAPAPAVPESPAKAERIEAALADLIPLVEQAIQIDTNPETGESGYRSQWDSDAAYAVAAASAALAAAPAAPDAKGAA